jgi:hypothetical protein
MSELDIMINELTRDIEEDVNMNGADKELQDAINELRSATEHRQMVEELLKAKQEDFDRSDILNLFTIGIVGGNMTVGINADLEGMVDKENFMTNDEYDAIKTVVGNIVDRTIEGRL